MPDLTIALSFAAAVVFADRILVPVPLYSTAGCAPNYCVPVWPRIHVVPIVAGIVAALAWCGLQRGRIERRALLPGVLLGVAAILVIGALEAASHTFRDPYFTAPYKIYALGFLFTALAATGAFAASHVRGGTEPLARPFAAAIGLVLVAELGTVALDRQFAIASAGGLGLATGCAVGLTPRRVRPIRTTHAVAIVVVAGFAARATFGLLTLSRTGPGMAFAIASDDGDSYFTLSSRLASDPSAIGAILAGIAFPPGYTTFLAAIFGVSGGSLAAVILVQAALAAVAAYLLYRLAVGVFGQVAGVLAGVLFALDQNLIQNQSTLTAEALLIPQVIGALFAYVTYGRTRSIKWLWLGAALGGYAFVTRNLVALPLVVAACVWLLSLGHRSWRLRLRDVAVVLIMVLVFASPVAVATARQDGTPRLTTQLAGLAWTFEGAPGYTIGNGELIRRGINPFADPIGSLGQALTDPALVLRFYAEAAPQRFSTLLFFSNPGFSDPLLIVNEAYFPNAFGETVRLILLLGLIVGIGATIAARLWRRTPELSLLCLFPLLYIAVFVLLFPPYHAFRYRIPVEPVRFLLEAGGGMVIANAIRDAWLASGDARLRMSTMRG